MEHDAGGFILLVLKYAYYVKSKKNRKLQSRQLLTGDRTLGRETMAFYSSFVVWFSSALTVLKFSERPFTNIAQGWSISTLIALRSLNLK